MERPGRVSEHLLRVAAAVWRGSLGRDGATNVLSRLADDLETAGPVKLKLVSTEPSLEEGADETTFRQEWVFVLPDGSSIRTTTDAGWGDEAAPETHGDFVLDVCGHPMTIEEILGFVISTGDGPVEDGEEFALDSGWCSRMVDGSRPG